MTTKRETKICSHCKKLRALSEFRRTSSTVDGLHTVCRYCNTKATRERRHYGKGIRGRTTPMREILLAGARVQAEGAIDVLASLDKAELNQDRQAFAGKIDETIHKLHHALATMDANSEAQQGG